MKQSSSNKQQLAKYFELVVPSDNITMTVQKHIADVICYMFDVEFPKKTIKDPYTYRERLVFDDKSIKKINSQLVCPYAKLNEGVISIGDFLLLMNSSKFPYNLIGVSTSWTGGSRSYTFYHFLRKMNPFKSDNSVLF